MNKKIQLFIVVILILAVLGCFALLLFCHHDQKIYVWAWERPEDLRFLGKDKDSVVIVYYAGDVVIENGGMEITPRRNRLILPQDVPIIPLVRIDNFDNAEVLDDQRLGDIKKFIVQICSITGISGCQIDFDVLSSERAFYTRLISEVKKEISPNIPLSITALVSWCDKHSWLDETEIDFAVPMFYRLGPDSMQIQTGRVGSTFLKSEKCQSAIGISTDEQLPRKTYLQGKDTYFFNPEPWTEESFIFEKNAITD